MTDRRVTTATLALVLVGLLVGGAVVVVLLVLDHTAYHLGELVVVRRALGIWR